MKTDLVISDSIYYKIEINNLEINLVNESNDTLLFIPDFIIEGLNDSGAFINTRSNIYSNNLLYFLPKDVNLLFSGLILQNFNDFPQMFLILPNTRLLIKFDIEELLKRQLDFGDKIIFSKLRVANKKIFDELFFKEFKESIGLPYNSHLVLESIKIIPDLNINKNFDSYDMNNPNLIVHILNNSFNILPKNITDK
ncbi:MAG TPA: hypothetical protein PLG90_05685 [Ignavibacteria bacterium]|nr:hypothetical protein [Ignavibacteria bacterium]